MSTVDMDRLIAIAHDTWERVVGAQGRKAEWVPKMLTMDDEGHAVVGGFVGGFEDAIVMVAAVDQLVTAATAWVAVTVDTYVSSDPALHASDRPLSEWYARGHPSVVDSLVIFMVERGGRAVMTQLPYRIRSRKVHWLEENRTDSSDEFNHIGGRLAEALIAVMSRGAN